MLELPRNGTPRVAVPARRRVQKKYGLIVTFENPAGQTLTLHREGPPKEALRQAIAIALAKDETYRVASVSSPETIYRDLQGSRGTDSTKGLLNFPELSKVPFAMLHPRLQRGDGKPHRRARA